MAMRYDKTLIIMSSGFLVVIAAMVLLLAIAIDSMQANIDQIDRVTYTQSKKTFLVNEMFAAARERTLNMMKMIAYDDPFFRDEEMLKFNHQGAIFADARMQLMEMDLSVEELDVLEKQGNLTRQVVPLQRSIVDHLLDQSHDDTLQLLIHQAIPMQDQVFEILSRLKVIQRNVAEESFKVSLQKYKDTVITMSFLASIVFIACLFIAFYVVRHTINNSRILLHEKKRAQITLHSIGDGVITTNSDGRIEHMNLEAEKLTGWKNENAYDKRIDQVCRITTDDSNTDAVNPVELVIATQEIVNSKGDTIIHRTDNREYAIEYSAAPIMTSDNQLDGTILVFKNVTDMRLLTHKLTHQATHDSLTGLINRSEFEQQTRNLLEEARNGNKTHCLCYLDLDQFKVVNDTCGHIAGDELLKQVGVFLKSRLRDSDVLGRLGGDEFGIIFRDCTISKAADIMESIRDAMQSQRFNWEDKSFSTNISAGLVVMDHRSGSLYDLYSTADASCYLAKDKGRNRIHVYSEDDLALSKRTGEMQWVHRIVKALEQDRFILYYQTIQSLDDDGGDDFRCELLIRMVSEEGKLIPPMAFIPAAERYNLMTSIDRWVVTRALSSIANLGDYTKSHHCRFSINLSAQSLSDDKFLDFLKSQIDIYGAATENLCFEVTETAAIANLTAARRFMANLREMGCKFSLDDFGSGLSSFEYLRNLPVDYLKIDGAFVRNIINDPIDRAMVHSIHQVGEVMGISTIAEFVEDEKTLSLLKELGINYAQGFAVAKPQPMDSISSIENETLVTG